MKREILDNYGGVIRRVHTDDNQMIFDTVQDHKPIIDHNKAMQALGHNTKAQGRHAASIPLDIYEQWNRQFKRETGKGLMGGNAKDVQKFLHKKLNDPDNKFMRTWAGRL